MTRDERYRAEEGRLPVPLTVGASISWRAVAAFLLEAVERDLYPRRIVGLVGDVTAT
jgi:hypothetical protein